MSLTYKECKAQYESLKKTFDCVAGREKELKAFFKAKQPRSFTFTGSGSGYYLAQSFEMIAKVKMGICSSSIPAGDLMLHYERYSKLLEGTMLIVASRSGSTSEVISSVKRLKASSNIPVLSVVCVENSELSQISDYTVCIPWAFDESVCQTRTVSNLYAAMVQIIGYLSEDKPVIEGLEKVIGSGDEYMAKYEKELERIAGLDWDNAVVLADGEIQGLANEGALAFKEIAQTSSNYYHLLDSRHGPMVMVKKNTLAIACLTSEDYKKQKDLISDIVKKGARIVVYTDTNVEKIGGVDLHVSSGYEMEHVLRGIPFIFIPQMISYYRAVKTGVNPDRPEGLDAWIKL
ncbi:MAG: SIS domain-containing protein [Ruminiclostridium sp.]|nr:SIS domain-containing protein [Ruminiclostridium sp.]